MTNNKRKVILEYIWLDGYETQNLRSKIKITNESEIARTEFGTVDVESLPVWNFDGSSTRQAPGSESECLLKPVRVYNEHAHYFYVLCEVFNNDMTPHETNTRASLRKNTETHVVDSSKFWWGFEQEYFLKGTNGRPLGFPDAGYPKTPQGTYYCAVGHDNVKLRHFAHTHMHACLGLGIDITGVNAEVAIGQWEYQCFNSDTLKACDDLWMTRYLLHRVSEEFDVTVDLEPKPEKGDWNGSGCHTNFSTKAMREPGGMKVIEEACKSLEKTHDKHITVYGAQNDQRLTGLHETQKIDTFSYGVGDRGASIRIPNAMKDNGWNGYIEDRRPASNCDPYLVAKNIIKSTQESKMI